MSEERTVELVYDGSCPVCNLYSRHVTVDQREARLERIDAREPGELVDVIADAGLDIDEGMVVRIDGRLHFGAGAVHELAKMSAGGDLPGRLIAVVFRSRRRAEVCYPVLRTCRRLLLTLLGRPRINDSDRQRSARS